MPELISSPYGVKLRERTKQVIDTTARVAPQYASRTRQELFSARRGEGRQAVGIFSQALTPAKKKIKPPSGYSGTGGLDVYELLGLK